MALCLLTLLRFLSLCELNAQQYAVQGANCAYNTQQRTQQVIQQADDRAGDLCVICRKGGAGHHHGHQHHSAKFSAYALFIHAANLDEKCVNLFHNRFPP